MKASELSQHPEAQVLDVRLPDDYEAAHLTGARNNCVFEVAFAERLEQTAPDRTKKTIVYGANRESQEAAAALEKLRRLGYADLDALDGGFSGAEASGLEIKRGTPLPAPLPALENTHPIDFKESFVHWTGRNLLNRHWGAIPIIKGELVFSGGALTGGTVELDLTKITCADLAGTPMHDVLIAHLHNDDFFDVTNHPTATLDLTGSSPLPEASPGGANLQIDATLNLRGTTQPIQFVAATGRTPEGLAAAQATFSIDRTKWNILYGSGKFFHRLAGHLVNDLIDFEVKIVTSGADSGK